MGFQAFFRPRLAMNANRSIWSQRSNNQPAWTTAACYQQPLLLVAMRPWQMMNVVSVCYKTIVEYQKWYRFVLLMDENVYNYFTFKFLIIYN